MDSQLIECNICKGNACYEQVIVDDNFPETVTTYMCFGCGMTTTSLMKKSSVQVKETFNRSPELYKDLSVTDENGLVWFPATVTVPEKGMVFIDGTSKKNWVWKAVKAVRILEEEKGMYPEGNEFRMDMKNAKTYGQRDFIDALDYIDFWTL